MSEDNREDDAKKMVREETEPAQRSDAPWQQPAKPEELGGFRDLFEDMWNDLEGHDDSEKG